MPIQKCEIKGKKGIRWGSRGTCYPYTPGNKQSRANAIAKAMKQAIAIQKSGGK